MPEYIYQYSYQTPDFERDLIDHIPVGDPLNSINTIFSTLIKIDVPASAKEDLDDFMRNKGASEVSAIEAPTEQVAIASISRIFSEGNTSQQITSSLQKVNFFTTNDRSTDGVVTADQANNEITIDSVFNVNTGDNYRVSGIVALRIPRRDFCIFEVTHDDNGTLNKVSEVPAYGLSNNNGPIIVPINGTFIVTSDVNQSVYLRAYTIGGNEIVNYYSGSFTLERI